MTVRRLLAVVALTVATVPLTGAPAAAHGAPTNPASRAAACGPEGRQAGTPACRAAVEAGAALREWDNIRVFGVAGRDRERIPDGELCSGGLSAYRGLDLPRADWPVTKLAAGARFTFRYRTTIPHKGTFRLYVTREGYNPTKRLTWASLESVPFLRVTDPPVRDGAYQLPGRLPADRSGRHLIYTVWQNSDTPDTYYSCSDVEFRPVAASAGFGGPTTPGRPADTGATPGGPAAASGGVAASRAGTGSCQGPKPSRPAASSSGARPPGGAVSAANQ
ncbi:lytic polysaccharide monooxygenase auxiliary activity family 9 protein [Micromonospora phytophila]|uniref:lytic polysaccharide monooxygenase auxiliary activity family 9 protein n=1 Tax=Micromonospora phytophila TaxID=709888 RepID=UPI0025482596|nr:lytic polysaccharide monooxygenase [Micromonospora phytophila]